MDVGQHFFYKKADLGRSFPEKRDLGNISKKNKIGTLFSATIEV